MKLNLFWVPVTVAMLTAGCATQHVATARNFAGNQTPQHVFELKADQKAGETIAPSASEPVETVPEQLTMATAMAPIRPMVSLPLHPHRLRSDQHPGAHRPTHGVAHPDGLPQGAPLQGLSPGLDP